MGNLNCAIFILEDDFHAEYCGEFKTFEDALEELKLRSKILWDKIPNRCPCTSWKTCHRDYAIIEYDDSKTPWEELSKVFVLTISSSGVKWKKEFKQI